MMFKLVYFVSACGLMAATFVGLSTRPVYGETPVSPSGSPTIEVDTPELLVPKKPRDEATEDRLLASALFAEGRLLYRREQFELALQRYERAYRYSNGSSTILSEVIPLAFGSGRFDEAARYAKLATQGIRVDPFVLRRLALHLTDQEQFDQALHLYRIARQGTDDDAEPVPTAITQFEIGRLLYLTGQFASAADCFGPVQELILREDPPDAEKPAIEALLKEREVTFSLIAESYLRADQPRRAGDAFRLAYQNKTDAAIFDFHMARVLSGIQDWVPALDRLRRYLKSGDSDAGTAPYELLSKLLNETNQTDQLQPELEALFAKQDKNVFLAYYLGLRHLQRKEPELAIRQFERLMQIRPLIDGYRGLVRARLQQRDAESMVRLLAEASARLGGLAALDPVLDEIVADPNWVDQIKETVDREFLSDESAESDSLERGVATALAELLAHSGDSVTADRLYRRAAHAGDAGAAEWLAWGMHRLVGDQPANAIDVFRQAIAATDDPQQSGPFYFYLAAALALNEQPNEALVTARKAADLAHDIPAIQLRPAWVLMLARHWSEAAAAYEGFLDRFGDQHGSADLREMVREAKTSLSSICVFLEQHLAAEEWLEQVLDEFPENVGAQNDLGYLWADRGIHLRRALRMTEYAVNEQPDNVAYRDSYGWALYRIGRSREAVEQLRMAAQTDPPDAVILDHLGDAMERTEGMGAAVDVWQRALKRLGDNEPKRRIRLEQKIRRATQP